MKNKGFGQTVYMGVGVIISLDFQITRVCLYYKQTNDIHMQMLVCSNNKLDSMIMKHYAPNRCLYIKVAKFRTGVGFAEMLHPQKFEAHSCNSFQDIMITNFLSPNLQREIIRKKIK